MTLGQVAWCSTLDFRSYFAYICWFSGLSAACVQTRASSCRRCPPGKSSLASYAGRELWRAKAFSALLVDQISVDRHVDVTLGTRRHHVVGNEVLCGVNGATDLWSKGIDHGIVFPVWSIALRSLAVRRLSTWTSQVNERIQLLGNLRRRNRSRRDWYSAATVHISRKVKTHFLSRRVGIRIVALFRFGTWFGVHGPFPPVLPFNAQAARNGLG